MAVLLEMRRVWAGEQWAWHGGVGSPEAKRIKHWTLLEARRLLEPCVVAEATVRGAWCGGAWCGGAIRVVVTEGQKWKCSTAGSRASTLR